MSYTFDQAIADIANRSTLVDLIDFVRNTNVQIEGTPADVTSVPYKNPR